MRSRLPAMSVLLILSLTSSLLADDHAEALKLVSKSLEAAGGAAKLEKLKASTWRERGTYYGMGEGLPYTGVYAVQWPDQFRMEIEGVFVVVLNGDQGWTKSGDTTTEMPADKLAEQKETHFSGYVTTLVPLKNKGFKLTLAEDLNVNDKPAKGILVKHEGHRDVKLHFDRETGLLVRAEYRAKAEELGGQEVTQVVTYADYREVEGIRVPAKIAITRDGKKFVEAENFDLKPVEKLDPSQFAKP